MCLCRDGSKLPDWEELMIEALVETKIERSQILVIDWDSFSTQRARDKGFLVARLEEFKDFDFNSLEPN